MPVPSTATGFSVKRCLPALIVASMCMRAEAGRGGEDHQVAAVDDLLIGVEADEAAVVGDVELVLACGVLAEPVAAVIEVVLEDVAHGVELDVVGRAGGLADVSAAPLPRPPQPIRPTLIVSLPAAWAFDSMPRPTVAAVEVFRKSRRDGGNGSSRLGSVMGCHPPVGIESGSIQCEHTISRGSGHATGRAASAARISASSCP